MNEFGENLRRLREEKGMSQQQLADSITISKPSISRWENGVIYPQVIWIYRIAKALDVNPEDLIKLPNTKHH